jgi:hypothetical protein
MGAHWSELWQRSEAGAWSRAWHEDFEADRLGERELTDPDDARDAVYLAIYDGPAGEMCGSFMYERREGAAIRRALVYGPDANMELRWLRVDGAPEPWELELASGAEIRRGDVAPRISVYDVSEAVRRHVLGQG